MKIEAGQWYRLRNGEIGYVFGKMLSEDAKYPVRIEIAGGNSFAFTADGHYYESRVKSLHDPVEHLPDCDSFTWVPPEPKPVYRPFASAAEFAPHRNRWVVPKACSVPKGLAFLCSIYSDNGVYTESGTIGWAGMLRDFKFEDGTPFGVLENKE